MHPLFIVISLLSWAALPATSMAVELDSIAAIVNGKAITCFQVEQDKQIMIQQLKEAGQGALPSDAALTERALESRIAQTIQLQEAAKLGLDVGDDEINAAMADIESRNNLPAGQLPAILKAQGIDIADYKETLRERLLSSKVINVAVRGNLNISEESMREYYRKHLANPAPIREVKLAQVFVALSSAPTAAQLTAAQDKAQKIYAKLIAGGNFKQIAALESDAPDAKQGGEMGWFFPGGIAPQFNEVFTLPVGGIAQPVRSPGGFHILRVNNERMKQPELGESYDEVHARHILIKIPDGADEATKAKIRYRTETIAQEMKKASDEEFSTRAKEVSQGPSAPTGGDLGWFRKGQMVAAFEDTAFALEPGDTSGIVESPFGLHVIRLIEKRHIDPNAFEAHRDRIQEALTNSEMQNQVPRWIAGLMAEAVIEQKGCAGNSAPVAALQQISPAAAPAPSKTASETVTGKPATDESPEAFLNAWKNSWAEKELDRYFAAYDNAASPDKRYSSFAAWKSYKKRVTGGNNNIRITLSNVKTTVLEKDKRVRLEFDQLFESDNHTSRNRKALELVRMDGAWKIVSEALLDR